MKTGTIESYKDLIVYKKAYELVLAIYEMTNNFPESERLGLTSQLRRCSVSVPSNIAEGYRRGRKEYVRYGLQNEVSKMLGTLIRKIGSGGNRA